MTGVSAPGPYELVPFDMTGDGVTSTAFRLEANAGRADGITQNVALVGGTAVALEVDLAAIDQAANDNADAGTVTLKIGTNVVAQYSFGAISVGQVLRHHLNGGYTPPTNGDYPLILTFSRAYPEMAGLWCLADNVRVAMPPSVVGISPTASGALLGGAWSGQMAMLDAWTNVVLMADDGQGHVGLSNPFDVRRLPVFMGTTVSNRMLIVQWSQAPAGWVLEKTTHLASPHWTSTGLAPTPTDSGAVILLPMTDTNCFYRLRFVGP